MFTIPGATKLKLDILEPSADMEAAVTELEAQISECVPLFTGNSDPVGDLQVLLQGLQGDLAECLRNRFVQLLTIICIFLFSESTPRSAVVCDFIQFQGHGSLDS